MGIKHVATMTFLVGGVSLLAPHAASACSSRTVCVTWKSQIQDDDVGESVVLGEAIPARGAKVTLIPPTPEHPVNTFLDQDGCVTFETQYAYGHKLIVHNEAWVGTLDPLDLTRVRVIREPERFEYQEDFIWVVDLHGLAPDDTVNVSIEPEEGDPIGPLMAVSTAVMHQFYELDIMPSAPYFWGTKPTLEIIYTDYKANANGACRTVSLGPDSRREKFVMAHEMGHWLKCEWGGDFGSYDDYVTYDYPSDDPDCQFDVVMGEIPSGAGSHGIRSAEWSLPAMNEGFAHLVASITFNDFADPSNLESEDGIFQYYKDINLESVPAYADFVNVGKSRVSLLGTGSLGGQNRWVDQKCNADWTEEHVSSELDWMRFFWYLLTHEGDAPTLREVLAWMDFARDDPITYVFDLVNVYSALLLAAEDSDMEPFVERIEDANCEHGVYNGTSCQ